MKDTKKGKRQHRALPRIRTTCAVPEQSQALLSLSHQRHHRLRLVSFLQLETEGRRGIPLRSKPHDDDDAADDCEGACDGDGDGAGDCGDGLSTTTT